MTICAASDALRLRLHPHTSLRNKVVAAALGVAPYTVDRWAQGRAGLFGETIAALDQLFRSLGDDRFLADCYHIPSAPQSSALWFIDGRSFAAPAGHHEFVRRRMGLHPSIPGDLRALSCRRGWVAVEHSPLGSVVLWHHTKVEPFSAKAASEWLVSNAAQISSVIRHVEIDGTFAEVRHDDALGAADALQSLTAPVHRRLWKVDRKPLDKAPAPLGKLLNSFYATPDKVLAAAFGMGLMPNSNVLTVRGSSVTNDLMGDAIDMPREKIVGRNVLDRGEDQNYGAMIHSHVVEALKGPTFYDIRVAAFGRDRNYDRLALPLGNQQVLTVARRLVAA